MTANTPITDEDLHAYVDDRLDAASREAVGRHLAANPALQRRVADWAAQRTALQAAFAPALRDPVPPELNPASVMEAQWRQRQRRASWRVAASVALALLAGGGAGWLARGQAMPEVTRLGIEAASAYRVFANDSAHATEVADRTALTGWMTQTLGRRIVLPDLSAQGYHLLGGRILAAMYGPAAQLVYQGSDDTRITIYVQPMRVGTEAPMRPVVARAVDGYAWIDRQVGYSVLSDGPRAGLHGLADTVRDAMRL